MRVNLKNTQFHQRLGFTLIEVIVALALLVSTTALAAPNVMAALDGSEDKADAAQMDYLLASFQMHQAPFNDEHTNQYDLLKPDNVEYTTDADGNITNVEIKAGAAVETLNLFLQDAMLDPTSDVYIEGVQCVTTEKSSKGGKPIFQAEESNGMLYIVCKSGDGNRSNAEIRIPGIDHISYNYSTGEQIRWGDSLLYIGDYENLESRFVSGQCQDYQMEAGFQFDNFDHTAQDHKSRMGLIFNYIDDQNFCLIDLELKNGSKQINIYQVSTEPGQSPIWKELDKNINVNNAFDLPGNQDYEKSISFRVRMTVWNSETDQSKVKLELAQAGVNNGNFDEIFSKSFSIAEDKKSSQYAFYIGEPDGNQIEQDGIVIENRDFDADPVDPEDPSTFQYENVQIQLLAYPSFICEGEDGSFNPGGESGSAEPTAIAVTTVDFTDTGVTARLSRLLKTDEEIQYQFFNKTNDNEGKWGTSSSFGGSDNKTKVNIRILRNGSEVFEPKIYYKATEFELVNFSYSLIEPEIMISGLNSIEYKWKLGIDAYSTPASGIESDANEVDYVLDSTQSGWLWAREYVDGGQGGNWSATPWIGTDEFNDGKLSKEDSKVSYQGSLPSSLIIEYKLNDGEWNTSKPTVSSQSDVVWSRVMYGKQQVSQLTRYSNSLSGSDATRPIITVTVDVKKNDTGSDVIITSNEMVTITGDIRATLNPGEKLTKSYNKQKTSLGFTATDRSNNETQVTISLTTDQQDVIFGK